MNANDVLKDHDFSKYRELYKLPPEELYKLAAHTKPAVRLLAAIIAPEKDLPLFISDPDLDVKNRVQDRLKRDSQAPS
jgi:hypothetical protein